MTDSLDAISLINLKFNVQKEIMQELIESNKDVIRSHTNLIQSNTNVMTMILESDRNFNEKTKDKMFISSIFFGVIIFQLSVIIMVLVS